MYVVCVRKKNKFMSETQIFVKMQILQLVPPCEMRVLRTTLETLHLQGDVRKFSILERDRLELSSPDAESRLVALTLSA